MNLNEKKPATLKLSDMPCTELSEEDIEVNKSRFLTLLLSTERKGLDRLVKFLETCEFFDAPASTRFHGAYRGGLCQHSLNVYDALKGMMESPRYKEAYEISYPEDTLIIAALLHDMHKADVYQAGTKNQKNEAGKWETVPAYAFEEMSPLGCGGEKSVIMLQKFIDLNPAETYAIRYHMGPESESETGRLSMHSAYDMCALALPLHLADMEATHLIENIKPRRF